MTSHSVSVYAGAARWNSGATRRCGLFRKAAAEAPWQPLAGLPQDAEVRAIAVHPRDPRLVFAGTQYGPYRSQDGGDHWEKLPFPDANAVVWSLCFHPTEPKRLYLGTAPAAVYCSDDGGERWQRLAVLHSSAVVTMDFPTRVVRLVFHPQRPNELYAGLEVGGVMRSLDGGATWQDCCRDLLRLAQQAHLKSRILSDTDTEGMMDTHALAISPAQPQTVILATRMGLFCSHDRGDTWEELPIRRFSSLTYARDVCVDAHTPHVLYACLSKAARSDAGALYRSPDLGQTWERFDRGVTARSTMMAVAVSRQDPKQLFCVTRDGEVFATTDGGATWQAYPLPPGVEDVYALACT